MNWPVRAFLKISLLVLCCPALPARAVEAPREPAPETVVVLDNGGVLRGHLTRQEDRYVLRSAHGEIVVDAAEVLEIAGSLEEAYAMRRQRATSAADHLALAEWCIRYGLLNQAEQELAAAEQLDPHHVRLPLLKRRRSLAVERASRPQTSPETSEETSKRTSEPSAPVPESVSVDVDPVVLERFTRRVQPILVNNCTAGGCHARGGDIEFQLDRAILHGLANRRSTMFNLSATLALVDRENPEDSPLIRVPRESHGGVEGAVFGPRDEQALRHVIAWIHLVAPPAPPASRVVEHAGAKASSPGDARALPSPILRAAGHETSASHEAESSGVVPAAAIEIEQPAYPSAGDEAFLPSTLHEPAPVQFGMALRAWTPRDEFDPEIFNRQQAARDAMRTKP